MGEVSLFRERRIALGNQLCDIMIIFESTKSIIGTTLLMKPILITLLSVALASSCANHEVKLLLTEAESLMQDHPDSALSIIESIDTAALMTKAQRADFSLLHAMALDKNYIDTTDLRVIAPAFRYFRNHGSDQNKMRTLYYQGRIYINADDYSNAVISLNNALEYAQGEEYLDKGRIYSALSVSYCNSHNNIEELTCSRHAYDNFLKSGSEKYLDSARYLLALSLRNNNLVDEADSVFNSIYSGKDSTARLSRTVMCAQASNCLQMDFPDYVKACELFGYLEKNGATFSENDILEYAFSLLNCGERGYGSDGNVSGVGYSTQDGVITTESYTYSYGHNTRISLPDGTLAWRLDSENDLGMPTSATTGSVTREYGYTSFGLPTYRWMDNGALQDFTYQFDVTTGNLLVRQDGVNGQAETFGYDNLNRLTAIGGRQISYSDNGNVISMDGVGTMSYENGSKPYQITSLHPADEALVPSRAQSVSYTCYSRPSILTEGGRSAAFTYNGDGDRVKMYVADGTAEVLTRHYIGSRYEHDHTPSGSKERLYLGGDAYSALMVYQRENGGSWTLYNIGRDYLGNVTHIATSGGTLVAEYSYDPWGRLRDPDTHAVYSPGQEPELFLGRGFTGHEHLPWFGLVNMNARLYDPLLGRFLSPDPYVQAPDFTQNYNRYIYCLNNPLKFTDVSGELFGIDDAIIVVAAGALLGAYSGGVIANDGQKNPIRWDYGSTKTWGYMLGGVVVGGVSGWAGGAIAGSGIPMANTLGMMSSSLIYSVGTNIYTDGRTPISISFGFASYDFTNDKWSTFSKNNEWYENMGYALGAIANFSDISRGYHNDIVQLQTENTTQKQGGGKDFIGHSQLLGKDGKSLIDFGPSGNFYKFNKGMNNWIDHASRGRINQTIDIPNNIYKDAQFIKGVNLKAIQRFSNRLNNKSGFYNFALRNCSTQAARALTLGGVPVWGLHPYLLRFHISTGLRPYMFSYIYTNDY